MTAMTTKFRRLLRGALPAALLALAGLGLAAEPRDAAPFSFAVLGNVPYDEEEERLLAGMIENLNRQDLAFVLHVGDIKNGDSLCGAELFRKRKQLFESSRHPLVYVPGDNDWTDCHREGGYDPLERLDKLREIFFQGDRSLGSRYLKLTRQSADPQFHPYRENVRWVYRNVVFVGVNIPGSNNNLGRSPEADAEHYRRVTVNRAWMKQAFDLARRENLGAVVIFIHGDPQFELPLDDKRKSGYSAFVTLMAQQALMFGKPVLLIHGDSRAYHDDRPLQDPITGRRMENFHRLGSLGSPAVGHVRVTVDLPAARPFRYAPVRAQP